MIQATFEPPGFDYNQAVPDALGPREWYRTHMITKVEPCHSKEGALYIKLQIEDSDGRRESLEINPTLTRRLLDNLGLVEYNPNVGEDQIYVDSLEGQEVTFVYSRRANPGSLIDFVRPLETRRGVVNGLGSIFI